MGEGGRRLVLRRGQELLSVLKAPEASGDRLQQALGDLFPLFPWRPGRAPDSLAREVNAFLTQTRSRKEKYTRMVLPKLDPGTKYLRYAGVHDLLVLICIKPHFPSKGEWIEGFSSQRKANIGQPLCDCLTRGEFYNACTSKDALLTWLTRAYFCNINHHSNQLTVYDFASDAPMLSCNEADRIFNILACALTGENNNICHHICRLAKMLQTLYYVCSSTSLQYVASAKEYACFSTNYKGLSHRAAEIVKQLYAGERLPPYDELPYIDKLVCILIFKTLSDASLLFYISKANGNVQLYITDLELKSVERIEKWASILPKNDDHGEQ